VSPRIAEVPGFPGYRVTGAGVVESRHRRGTRELGDWHALRPSPDAKGYSCLTICSTVTGARRPVRVHRLVAELLIPNPLGLPCVRHLNGDGSDNRVENLAWGTYLDNENDKHAHGTYDLRRNGKLTPELANEVRQRAANGERQVDLAVSFGVSRPTITRIVNGTIWR
jgi:hypothetical protein